MPGRGSVSSTSLVLVTACTLMSACGGEEFTAASGGAAGSAGSGGAGGGSGSSGDGGASGSAGNAGASGSGGSGGASACDCRDGEYCRGGKCTSCSDFGRFSFAKPELVSALPSGSRYPRIGDGPGTLFYSVDQLLRTPDLTAGPGVVVSPANSPRQIAPLYVENSAGLGYNLLFTQFDSDQLPKIFAATWDGSSVTAPQELQGIVNGGAGDYSPALAGSRLWWVSQRNGDPGLFTYLSGQPNEDALQSDVRNSLGSPCHAVSEDFAPWVTADGEHILFAALPAADNCNPIEGAASDLFVGLLDPNTGELVQAASPLNVNVEGDSAETDPSLSGDLCTLYFASNREGGGYRIYRAERN